MSPSNTPPPPLRLGADRLSLHDVRRVALGRTPVVLDHAARDRMAASAAVIARLVADDTQTYGVTTSVGASVTTRVPGALSAELSKNLVRMHGVGTGPPLSAEATAAVLTVRLSTLAVGKSGIRPVIAERLLELLQHRVLPVIPAEGSVGASGDLTPMSYVAAVLCGEREVHGERGPRPAAEVLAELDIEPIVFAPKEALSLMNGTSVAAAIAAMAWLAAERIARLSALVTASIAQAVGGRAEHYDAAIHAARPHPGQRAVAAWITDDIGTPHPRPGHLQDRYSLRCTPHIVGVLVDALSTARGWLETELNGVSDNPIVDVERGVALHGGNFYGGHVGFACDMLKLAVAQVCGLVDRQLNLLCNPAENHGLPANLVGAEGPAACTHNGFKAATIATSALAAEAMKLTVPAGAFTRSTELHNQDQVPMASIAARDLARVVELTEQALAITTLAAAQAIDLRGRQIEAGEIAPGALSARALKLHRTVRSRVRPLAGDRRMDHDIAEVLDLMRTGELDGLLDLDEPAARR